MNLKRTRVCTQAAMLLLLATVVCSCDDETKDNAQPPSSGSAYARRILYASQVVYSVDDYNPELKGWSKKAYPAFHDLGIELEMVRPLDRDRAVAPSAFCPYLPGLDCENCTALWVDPDVALQYCGTRLQLALYVYRYKTGPGRAYKYHDALFYAGPGVPVDDHELAGIYVYIDEDPATTDTLGLFNGAFIFPNIVSDIVSNTWGIPWNELTGAARDVIGHMQAHEIGHMAYGLRDANYSDTEDPDNGFHELSFNPPHECLMNRYLVKEEVVRDGFAQFCRDLVPDGIATNSCKDNLGR